jgi:hypothetical protein
VDDFEAFRKKKQAEKDQAKEAEAQEKKFDEAAKKMGWVDGFGFQGPTNPKVKGFVLGRARRKKVDPNTLERPKGMESHRHDAPPEGEKAAPKPAEKPPEKPKGYSRY